MKYFPIVVLILFSNFSYTQTVTITIHANEDIKPISPWIYGRNNNISDNPSEPTSDAAWQKYNDAGLRMYRENGGNNATKYNWKRKITSHPDWYNNVYSHDWDYTAASLQSLSKGTQGLFAFQLLGKAASNKNNNFNDWDYNQSQWWTGVSNNWAGGGGPNKSGNPDLYLMDWPADSSTAILDHWFTDLHLDSTRFKYWNMDNEPEIWQSTHDDIATSSITAENFMQKYFAVAKAARKKFPGIKLTGPVSPNEWQWYNWNNQKVIDLKDGKQYCWIEYFIKRIGEEQKSSGMRLLDVIDFHFYPGTESDAALTLQLHRLWFDTEYEYPQANGVKVTGTSGWDSNIKREYIFERCNQWLNKYIGPNHDVHFGISEYGAIANNGNEDPNIIACWYASHLGTFAKNQVDFFTPWDWYRGQWEVLHLFSNYFGKSSIRSESSLDSLVSAYSSLSENKDSLIIVIVNRDMNNIQSIDLQIENFIPSLTKVNGLQLANLPLSETFISKKDNALKNVEFLINDNHLTFDVPKLSVSLIQIPTNFPVITSNIISKPDGANLFPNPVKDRLNIVLNTPEEAEAKVFDIFGKKLGEWHLNSKYQIDFTCFPLGTYILQLQQGDKTIIKKIIKE